MTKTKSQSEILTGKNTISIDDSDLPAWQEFLSNKKRKEQLESSKTKLLADWSNLQTLFGEIKTADATFSEPWKTAKGSKTATGTPKYKILVYLKDGHGRTLSEIAGATQLELTTKKQSHLYQLTKSKHLTLADDKYTITELGKTDASK